MFALKKKPSDFRQELEDIQERLATTDPANDAEFGELVTRESVLQRQIEAADQRDAANKRKALVAEAISKRKERVAAIASDQKDAKQLARDLDGRLGKELRDAAAAYLDTRAKVERLTGRKIGDGLSLDVINFGLAEARDSLLTGLDEPEQIELQKHARAWSTVERAADAARYGNGPTQRRFFGFNKPGNPDGDALAFIESIQFEHGHDADRAAYAVIIEGREIA